MNAIKTTPSITIFSIITLAIILQQSVSAIVISPVITANLAPSQYHIKDQYSFKNLVVKNMTRAHGDNSTFRLVGYTSMPEVAISKKSGNVVFGGRLAIYSGNTTKYIPIDISMLTVNKTVDPETNIITMELGKDSDININESLRAIGKVVLTGKPETSTMLVRVYDNRTGAMVID